MKEPKMPKIKVEHTIRIKGLNRTVFWGLLAVGCIQAINQQLNKMTREHKDDIVDAAERFGKKVGDEDLGDRVKDAFKDAGFRDDMTGDREGDGFGGDKE